MSDFIEICSVVQEIKHADRRIGLSFMFPVVSISCKEHNWPLLFMKVLVLMTCVDGSELRDTLQTLKNEKCFKWNADLL
jgi:hypothetical protein